MTFWVWIPRTWTPKLEMRKMPYWVSWGSVVPRRLQCGRYLWRKREDPVVMGWQSGDARQGEPVARGPQHGHLLLCSVVACFLRQTWCCSESIRFLSDARYCREVVSD